MVARAHAYLEALTGGQGVGRKDVAKRFGVHPEDVSRLLPPAFLSPRIVEAILTGQQPADLAVRHLVRNVELPVVWAERSKPPGISGSPASTLRARNHRKPDIVDTEKPSLRPAPAKAARTPASSLA